MKKLTFLLATLLAFLPQSSDAAGFTIGAEQINLDGYSLRCDSFNSSDTNRSTDGHYDPAKAGDDSHVGVAKGIFDSGHGGIASIWGYLETQVPFTLEIGTGGSIGSTAWHLAGTPGIEPGHHHHQLRQYVARCHRALHHFGAGGRNGEWRRLHLYFEHRRLRIE